MIIYSCVDPCNPKAMVFMTPVRRRHTVSVHFCEGVRAVYCGDIRTPFVSFREDDVLTVGRDVVDIIGYLETGSKDLLGER